MKIAKRSVGFGVLALLLLSGQAFAQYGPQGSGSGSIHEKGMQALQQKDYRTAYAVFSSMAKQGDPDALFHLGVMHENGEGVKRDLDQAYARFYLAGKRGHQTAAQYANDLQRALSPDKSAAIRRQMDSKSGGAISRRGPQPQGNRGNYRPSGATPPIRPSQDRPPQPNY